MIFRALVLRIRSDGRLHVGEMSSVVSKLGPVTRKSRDFTATFLVT